MNTKITAQPEQRNVSLNLAPATVAAGKAPRGNSRTVITYVNRDGVFSLFLSSALLQWKGVEK